MKYLKELASILHRKKTQQIHIIGDSTFKGTLIEQFYDAVLEGKVQTDTEAAMLLYGTPEISAKYRNLKSALRKRLLNTLYFMNMDKEVIGEQGAVRAECWRMWTQNRLLVANSGLLTAVDLEKKILRNALEYEYSDIAGIAAKSLRSFYALNAKKRKEFEHYDAIFKQQREYEYWENEADEYYQRIVMTYAAKSTSISPEIKGAVEAALAVLLPKKEEIPTMIFNVRLIGIQLLGAMGTYDYRAAKKIAIDGLAYYEGKKNVFNTNIVNLLLHKLVCHTQLCEYEEGWQTAEECKELLEEGSYDWFKAQEYLFQLALHTQRYQEAYEIHYKMEQHPDFGQYAYYFGELWTLYRGYLYFMLKIDKVTLDKEDRRFDNFRVQRFLNELLRLSQDKSGRNISILILQMLFFIAENKRDDALNRIEAVEKYRIRYSNQEENFRADCFIRMLQLIPKEDFRAKSIEQKAMRYLEEMKAVPINFSNQSHEAEILPFPEIWKWTLYFIRRLK